MEEPGHCQSLVLYVLRQREELVLDFITMKARAGIQGTGPARVPVGGLSYRRPNRNDTGLYAIKPLSLNV